MEWISTMVLKLECQERQKIPLPGALNVEVVL
jgi:hypothetical protein